MWWSSSTSCPLSPAMLWQYFLKIYIRNKFDQAHFLQSQYISVLDDIACRHVSLPTPKLIEIYIIHEVILFWYLKIEMVISIGMSFFLELEFVTRLAMEYLTWLCRIKFDVQWCLFCRINIKWIELKKIP